MYKNVIDPGKSVSFVLKDIDICGQIQYLMCTGPLSNIIVTKTFKCKHTQYFEKVRIKHCCRRDMSKSVHLM